MSHALSLRTTTALLRTRLLSYHLASRSTMSFPSTMQAITISKTGGLEVLEKREVPFPTQLPGNVIVKVQYGGVNFIDTYYRKGLYPIQQFPHILGAEAAGTIVSLPTDAKVLNSEDYNKVKLKIGDKVAVFGPNAHAEYVSIPWYKAYVLPESVSVKIGAASVLQGITAVTFAEEAYNIKSGDYVFIHTIAGGYGLIMCQVAKHRGAIVIGTTSSQEKAQIAKAAGADHVILYPVEDTVKRVLEITNGEGVHVVYDGVGKDTFMDNFKLARRKGTLVSVGNASGAVEPIAPLKLVEKNLTLLRPTSALYTFTPSECLYYSTKLFDLISQGAIKIQIFKEYPFSAEGVREAQADLSERSGKTAGKLLIKISDE